MLEIKVPGDERWDARNNVFVYDKPAVLRLEHSLLSLSKWESKWHKAWLDPSKPKTQEETLDYIRCMTLTQGVDPSVYDRLTRETMAAIYQVIYSGAKKERPEAATSERSGEKVCGIGSTTGCINYSTRSTTHASPNFRREGGVSL